MSVILILLIASISVAAFFLVAFLWSVRSGQYDDEISPPLRMLHENPISQNIDSTNTTTTLKNIN